MITAKLKKGDWERFDKSIKELKSITGKPVHKILQQQGRLFALEAIESTMRVRRGKSSAKIGRDHKKAVKGTVLSTYRNAASAGKYLGPKLGKRWSNYVSRGDVSKLQFMANKFNLNAVYGGRTVNVMMWDNGKAHVDRLKKKGRKNTVNLVVNYKKVATYLRQKVKNVGLAKSGWASAAEKLGRQEGAINALGRVPKYIKDNRHRVRSIGRVKGRGIKSVLTVSNSSPYGIEKGMTDAVWRKRIKKMEKNIVIMLKAESDKAIKKV